MRRVALSWSSGKDSAWTLHVLKQTPDLDVVALITNFNCAEDRVAMHAVRRRLVEAQAEQARLPLWPVELPWPCSNTVYEDLMSGSWRRALSEGIEAIAFGDLFLQDIRGYREKQLQGTGLEPIFPLWNLPTRDLADDMIRGGLKATITCLDPKRLDRRYAGRDFDADFVADLPMSIDPCGENGEFHTFAFNAPVFASPIKLVKGESVERDGLVFTDLLCTRVGLRGLEVSASYKLTSSAITRFVLPPVGMRLRMSIAPGRDRRRPVWCANSRSSSTNLK